MRFSSTIYPYRQNRQTLLTFLYQLSGKIEGLKIGILKEGFGLKSSEADVDKMVREAAELLGTKCGAVVEEVSIPMHSDGNNCSLLSSNSLVFINQVIV